MKTSFKIFAIATFAILLCSCNKEVAPDTIGSQVQISAKITPCIVTRVTDDGTAFTDGDAIKVQNLSRDNKNLATYVYSAASGKWSTSDQLFWDGESLNDFNAWYPANAEYGSFTIPSDQTEGIADADWMTAASAAKRTDGNVELSFNHNLAKVTVHIRSWSNEYGVNERVVNSLELTSLSSNATYDGTVAGDNVAKWVKTNVSEANSSFKAIVAPGTYAAASEIMHIYVNGGSEPLSVMTSGSLELESGKAYNFELTIGRNVIELSSDAVTVTDWDDETLEDQVFEEAVFQLAEDASLNYELDFGSGELTLPLLSNVGTEISIEYDGTEAGWITYGNDVTTSSIINGLVVNVASNKSSSTRTARITLSNSYLNKTIILQVSQGIFTGLDDSTLDENKYITYVEDYDYVGNGDAFDYDMYYYGTTIYSAGLDMSTKIEYKFSLNDFTEGKFYLSVGEYDDSIYPIYFDVNGLNIGSSSDCYTWSEMGVSKTSVITLTLSGTTMVVNGKTITGTPALNRYIGDGYIWSGHYHERDDGMWWMDYTFQDGARIYYAKGWDSNGTLVYIGGAALSSDGRACWKSVYYDKYNSGDIVTQEHFPRVTSSFGRGNL